MSKFYSHQLFEGGHQFEYTILKFQPDFQILNQILVEISMLISREQYLDRGGYGFHIGASVKQISFLIKPFVVSSKK